MIWSTTPRELDQMNRRFRSAGRSSMLKTTELLHDALEKRGTPLDPITYFEIPRRAHAIGKLVVPYVNIDRRGFLSEGDPAIYGVTSNPDAHEDNPATERRSREAHVIADHLSFRRGIFVPTARAVSELLLSSMIPESYREGYITDRVAHLNALRGEADAFERMNSSDKTVLIEELDRGIDVLQDL